MSELTGQSEHELVALESSLPAAVAAPTEATEPRETAVNRFLGMIFNPIATLKDINRKPSWMVPFFATIVVSVAFSVYLSIKLNQGAINMVQKAKAQMAEKSDSRLMADPDIKSMKTAMTVLLVVSSIVVRALLFLVLSIVFASAFTLLRMRTNFRKVLSVLAWSNLIPHVCACLVAVVSLELASDQKIAQTDPYHFNSLVITNLAALINQDSHPVLRTALDSLDVFVIWFMVLLALGFSGVAEGKEMTRLKSGSIVFGLWGIWVIGKIAMTAIWN